MELNYKVRGSGEPLIIMHGLFGSLDNWQTLAKKFAEKFTVFTLDLRNHGRSPHDEEMNYRVMAEDLEEFMETHHIYNASILGHSMGGKVAMQFASISPDYIDKLIIADIAPVKYEGHHHAVFDALHSINLEEINERKDVEMAMNKVIGDIGVVQFLMKGLYRQKEMTFDWRFNLKAIHSSYDEILDKIDFPHPYKGETLFIRAIKSNYFTDSAGKKISEAFSNYIIKDIDAGHWVHAEAAEEFLKVVNEFLD